MSDSLDTRCPRRWRDGPFTLQAFQKTIFQWQPGRGLFRLNIYDKLSRAGLDDALLAQRLIPKPRAFPEDDGQPFGVRHGEPLGPA